MEATVFACLIMGVISALLALDSAACTGGILDACVLSPPANMVTLILSTATLVPVGACLITAWLDARGGATDEHKPLM
ncbi:hypothetical protein PHYBOEH_006153 [Phytophthora boehmeriae]|uniref:Uncharacterized protein n=1 Tax=Phytophthora boehmeriae TaxID=109152 RepID=A0A8T1WJE6_9STRA|nr:hypothetical protein PHYBOEH_006153 [Phytophthora boehmeriae]